MLTKTITTVVFAIGMSTASFAQTSPGLPTAWDQATTDAFFSDSATGTLRSQDEIQANWGTLSDEQQAEVRSHCATMAADAGADTTTAGDAGVTDETTTGATNDDTAGMTAADGQLTAMTELCAWVETQ